jgi:hypothetical protein
VKTLREAKALLDRNGLVTLSEYVEAIAGEKPKGSWWSHPKGKLIFDVTSALEDEPGVITCKLIEKRVTFVGPTLVPALLAVVTDPAWRRSRIAALSGPAKRLLSRLCVGEKGELEIDAKYKKPAAELAERLLVRSESRHTDSGRHATFLVVWRKVARLPAFSKATAELAEHGVDPIHLGRNLVESTP